jgi:hypothetical protein
MFSDIDFLPSGFDPVTGRRDFLYLFLRFGGQELR